MADTRTKCLFYSSFEKLEPHFFKTKKKSAKKKTEVFSSIIRLVRVSDFWVQNFLVYAFITTFLLYVQLM